MPNASIFDRFASAAVSSDATGWKIPVEPRRLARLDPEGDDVLDLEVDRVSDADAVTQPFLDDLDRRPLDAEHLADERGQPGHRPALLPAEDPR